ncbi:TetR family transcriptional regulator [Halovenus sp. WSH3]|uniref:TetR family transcriptional regulator n=1 Tax=Halovenus carboxidivorans TaxID=2692199 RepID=A0A6B0T9G7_9EURY|nr:TetR family transcriptional regulator C-terminal domain-containing protein [Halovenus carboxidivorans]MXR51510.1 TetR family transcriptional regulator [Halovenus carboxidivorans]
MGMPDPFESAPENTRTEIMQAAYDALREHGYSGLTMDRIDEQFPKSKSLIYQHYDGKDDLLVGLLAFLLERFEASVPEEATDDPEGQLREMLNHAIPTAPEPERTEFERAMTELRAQAAHDDAYREQFTRTDQFFHDRMAMVVRQGIASGVFREVDPDRAASFLMSVIHGTVNRQITTTDDDIGQTVQEELDAYIEHRLLAGDE